MKTFQLGLSVSIIILLPLELAIAIPIHSSTITQANRQGTAESFLKEAETLVQQGTAKSQQQAIGKYLEALQFRQALGNDLQSATILNKIGKVYQSLSDSQKAVTYYNQAISIYHFLGKFSQEAGVYRDLAMVYNVLGKRQKAIDSLETAQKIYRQLGDKGGIGLTFNNLGWIYYFFLGNKYKGMELYEEALKVYREAGDRSREPETLTQLAWGYYGLGDNQKALSYYNQAISIAREVGDRTAEGKALIYVSQVYESLKNKYQAISSLMAAQKIYIELGNRSEEARTYRHLGGTYWSFDEPQKAIKFYNQSILIHRDLGDRLEEGLVLKELGQLYYSLDENEKALDVLNQSLSIKQAVGDTLGQTEALDQIAHVESDRGNLKQALISIETCINLIETLRTSVYSQNLRTSFLSLMGDRYEFYIDLLMRSHKLNPASGYAAKALHISELYRARSLLELLAEANTDLRQSVDPQLLQQESTLAQQIEELEKRRLQLLNDSYTEEQLNTIDEEIASRVGEYEDVQTQIKVKSPRYAAIAQPKPVTATDIQSKLLDDNTLLLEYSLGEERSYLWAVTKTSITSYELPKRAEIEAAVKRFEQEDLVLIQMRPSQGVLAVDTLSQMLLAPVAEKLGNQRLVIVGDGILQSIPFSALAVQGKSGQKNHVVPLVVEHEIVNLPSASTLAALRHEVAGRKVAPKTVAVLADPVFGKDDQRVQGNRASVGSSVIPSLDNVPITEVDLQNSVRDAGVKLTRLLGTRSEAEAIMALVPDTQRTQFFDFQANKATATNPNLAEYQIVHFATHGILNTVHPELSGMVMSLVDEKGTPQNGFLRLHDIFNLNLPAELIVLSACQTGQGQEVKGEGIIGLTRGFMYAGAARVLVSLWKIDDTATAELMKRFYRGMLQEKLTPAAALKQAQVEVSQIPRWSSPYYWAGFVLQGEWR